MICQMFRRDEAQLLLMHAHIRAQWTRVGKDEHFGKLYAYIAAAGVDVEETTMH